MNQTESIGALAKSLSKAQGEIENASKDSENTFFKNAAGKSSKYPSLAAVLTEIRPVFARHGLSILQVPNLTEKGFVLVTRVMHESGEWIEGEYPIEPVKKDPQGYGSALTYARKYSSMSFAALAAEDDDGNEASGKVATGSKEAAKAVAERKIQESRQEAKAPPPAAAYPGRESFVEQIKKSSRAQLNVVLKNSADELAKKHGEYSKVLLAAALAELNVKSSSELDVDGARALAINLFDEMVNGPDGPPKDRNPVPPEVLDIWKQMTDIASTVKIFTYLRDLLGRHIGTATAETEYRGVLSSHGVMHSNEFRGAEGNVKARSAARQMWELIASAEKDAEGVTDQDIPN